MYYVYGFFRYIQLRALFVFSLVLGAAILGGYMAGIYLNPDKILSFMSRFVLMSETLSMMTRDPISFLIGFGPDSILAHFSLDRSTLVNSYFPVNMSIDSSHNVFIDILFQYGIFPILIIGYALITTWKNQKEELQIAILLGGIFLALNVFVVTHIVIFALLMAVYVSNKRA